MSQCQFKLAYSSKYLDDLKRSISVANHETLRARENLADSIVAVEILEKELAELTGEEG